LYLCLLYDATKLETEEPAFRTILTKGGKRCDHFSSVDSRGKKNSSLCTTKIGPEGEKV